MKTAIAQQAEEVLLIDSRFALCKVRQEGNNMIIAFVSDAGVGEDRGLHAESGASIRASFNAGRAVRIPRKMYLSRKQTGYVLPPPPTSPENQKRIDALTADPGFQQLLCNLYDRWQDEKEYENLADYAQPIRKSLPEGFVLTRMTKKPWGFEFNIGTGAEYAIRCNARNISWNRLK